MPGQPNYPVVTRTARLDLLGSLIGGFNVVEAQTTVYCQAPVGNGWTPGDAAGVALELDDWVLDTYDALMSNQATFVGVRFTDLGVENGFSNTYDFSRVGVVASELAAVVSAPVVQLLTAGGQYPSKSNVRPWGTPETGSHGNVVESTYRTNLTAAFDDLIARLEAFSGSSWGALTSQPVIISVYQPKAEGGGTPTTRYREVGLTSQVIAAGTKSLLGRCVSRQT